MFRRGERITTNVRVSHAGFSFASKLEASLFDHLKLIETTGELSLIKPQPTVYLTRARIGMRPDFSAVNLRGETEYFEAKGFETEIWLIKRKLWGFYGPGTLHIYKGGGKRGLKLVESITPVIDSEVQP